MNNNFEQIPADFLLSSFLEFIKIVSEKRADKESVLKQVQSFIAFSEKHNHDPVICQEYMKNSNTYRNLKSSNIAPPLPCIIMKINQDIQESTHLFEENIMVQTQSNFIGLSRALWIGMLVSERKIEFDDINHNCQVFNKFLSQFENSNINSIVSAMNASSETIQMADAFKIHVLQLLQGNQLNLHVQNILQLNRIVENTNSNSNLTIQQVIQVLYLLQSQIKTDICAIILFTQQNKELKTLTFNQQTQFKAKISIILHVSEDKELKYSVVIPSNSVQGFLQTAVREITINTLQLKDIFSLSTMENDFTEVDQLKKYLKAKQFENMTNNRIVSNSEYSSDKNMTHNRLLSNIEYSSDININLVQRECLRCKTKFQVDTKIYIVSVSHFCKNCKQNYSTNK